MVILPRLVSCLLLPALSFLLLCAGFARLRIKRSKRRGSWSGIFIGWLSFIIFIMGFLQLAVLAIVSVVRANL